MSRHRKYFRLYAALLCGALLAGAGAGSAADDRSEYLEALNACQAITDDAARLACFDRAASDILVAAQTGGLQVIDREQVRETRRKLFGFSLPDMGIFSSDSGNAGDDDEGDEVLETSIARARPIANSGWLITTREGAVWQIDNAPRRLLRPEPGQPVEFRKAALGSFFIRIDGQPGVKGKRVG